MKTDFEKPKWLTKENLIVVVLAGVLLLVICLPTKKNESSILDMNSGNITESSNNQSSRTEEGTDSEVLQRLYREEMEEQVRAILSNMEGVGRVEVLLTLQSSEELVVEKDTRIIRDSLEEDGNGGKTSSQSVDSEETTVYSQAQGSVNEPYVIKKIQPRVEGVFVIAEGAGSGTVNKNITEAIQVLFGIESHKIKVAKMKSN